MINEKVFYRILISISNKAKSNSDKECYLDLHDFEVGEVVTVDLTKQYVEYFNHMDGVVDAKLEGKGLILITVNDDFIKVYSD